MLNDASGFQKIYLATGYTDLRRGMEALSITPNQYAMLMQGVEIVARHPIEQTADPKKLF